MGRCQVSRWKPSQTSPLLRKVASAIPRMIIESACCDIFCKFVHTPLQVHALSYFSTQELIPVPVNYRERNIAPQRWYETFPQRQKAIVLHICTYFPNIPYCAIVVLACICGTSSSGQLWCQQWLERPLPDDSRLLFTPAQLSGNTVCAISSYMTMQHRVWDGHN